jgi:hypothetical protein
MHQQKTQYSGQIVNRSGFIRAGRRGSGLGGVRVTHLKIDFGLGLGRAKWSSGRVKF